MSAPKSCQAPATDWTRREFLWSAATTGALAAFPWPAIAAPRGTVTRYPLHIPPIYAPAAAALTAAPATVDLGDGRAASVLAYDGHFPGPTMVANQFDYVNVGLTNGLTEETTIHHHGMIVPTEADGHPKDVVAPGSSYTYSFPIIQRACLNWYHPHPHMMTGMQVNLGLAGAFIIRDAEEAALGLPSGAREVPLIIRDANFDKKGNLIYNPSTTGFDGKVPLVNGTLNPTLAVDTAVYRFRVLNGANARVFKLALSNGASFTLIGNDGGLLESAVQIGQMEIGPADRLDLLLDFRNLALGTKVMLRDLNSGWNLLEFHVTTAVTDSTVVPTVLSSIERLSDPVITRTFTFEGMSKINGKVYEMERIDFQVPFGQVERWVFKTGRNAPHPIHVHGASFQVQSRSGGRGVVFPWERGWKDTVLLLDTEMVEVLIRFDGYRGLYLLHCHKLEHEDMGMMSNFEVV